MGWRRRFNRYVADSIGTIDPEVTRLQLPAADLIDPYETIAPSPDGEVKRLVAPAQTAAEEASMWAVKAVYGGLSVLFPGPCLLCGARGYSLSAADPGICPRVRHEKAALLLGVWNAPEDSSASTSTTACWAPGR